MYFLSCFCFKCSTNSWRPEISFLHSGHVNSCTSPNRTALHILGCTSEFVALGLGVVVLSEPLTWGILVGFPLVIIGSFLATRRAPAVEAEPHP